MKLGFCFLTLNLFKSFYSRLLDLLEAKSGKQSHQSLIFSQALVLSPPFLLPFSPKNVMCSNEHSKTTFGLLNSFKCNALFGLHTYYHFSFSPFLVLSHLFYIRPCLATKMHSWVKFLFNCYIAHKSLKLHFNSHNYT